MPRYIQDYRPYSLCWTVTSRCEYSMILYEYSMNAQGRLCRLHTAQALQLVRGGSSGVSRTTPNHQVLIKWGGGDICRDAGTVYKMGGGGVTSAESPNPYKMGEGGGVTPLFLIKKPRHKEGALPHFIRDI